jgi:hypothetical protein
MNPVSSGRLASPTGDVQTSARGNSSVMAVIQGAPLLSEREIPAELRERLGLSELQSLRVLTSTPRTVLLERTGPESTPLPFDRDLVLTADVRAFPLADLLQLVHASAKSGFLYFEHGNCAKTVYLHAGEVVFATSNQRVDRLGECLLRSGAITTEQLLEAERVYKPPAPFGRFLVELGFLSPRQLWDGVKAQVEETVRSLFSFGAGSVLFWEGEVRPDNVVRLALPTKRLVAEGLSQRDALLRFLAQLEDPSVRLRPVEGVALAEDGSFSSMCRRVGIDPLSGARTVRLLRETNKLTIQRAGAQEAAAAEAGPPPDQDRLQECVRAHITLLAELATPIIALDGADALNGRLDQVVKASAGRKTLLAELEFKGGVLDPQAVYERALRFPGDRRRAVRTALGELVAYLEFELSNHPRIEDAQGYLEDLEKLRAAL